MHEVACITHDRPTRRARHSYLMSIYSVKPLEKTLPKHTYHRNVQWLICYVAPRNDLGRASAFGLDSRHTPILVSMVGGV